CRPCDGQRRRAATDELRIKDEKGQPAEMVAVEMRDEDRADRVRIYFEFANSDHGRCTAVHEEGTFSIAYIKAGVETSAAAESVARSEKSQFHRNPRFASRESDDPSGFNPIHEDMMERLPFEAPESLFF